jgi:hypothetical protein
MHFGNKMALEKVHSCKSGNSKYRYGWATALGEGAFFYDNRVCDKGTRCSSANAPNSERPSKAWIWPHTSISPKRKGSLRSVSRKIFQKWLFAITILGSQAVVAGLAEGLVQSMICTVNNLHNTWTSWNLVHRKSFLVQVIRVSSNFVLIVVYGITAISGRTGLIYTGPTKIPDSPQSFQGLFVWDQGLYNGFLIQYIQRLL